MGQKPKLGEDEAWNVLGCLCVLLVIVHVHGHPVPKGSESKLSLRLEDFESTTTSRKSVGGRSEKERRGAVM